MQAIRKFVFNYIFAAVFTTMARYIDIWGGRGGGRSHFGTMYFLYLITQPAYFRGVFLRNVAADIRDSLFKDFKDRIEECGFDEDEFEINESKMTIKYLATGNTIISKGFRKSSSNRSAKLKSLAGITHVLIEEADENEKDDVNKLDDSVRTNKIERIQIIFLHNAPPKDHWLCDKFYKLTPVVDAYGQLVIDEDGNQIPYYRADPRTDNPDNLVIFSDYTLNVENMNESTVNKYLSNGDPNHPDYDPDYFYVDVCGFIPEGVRGRIYKNWQSLPDHLWDKLPYETFYGLDFGFSNDPVALVALKTHNRRLFVKELIYEVDLLDPDLVKKMRHLNIPSNALIYADAAEPKSIAQIKQLGYFNVKEADKGEVNFGIKVLKAVEVYMTDGSKNGWKENREYKWHLGQDGKPTDSPIDKWNHIKDAVRYGYVTHKELKRKKKVTVAKPDPSQQAPGAEAAKKSPLDWLD